MDQSMLKAREVCRCLKGISHEFRLAVLLALRSGERSVNELAERVGCSQPTLSQHLSIMKDRKILDTRRKGNQVFYRVRDRRIFDLLKLLQKVFCGATIWALVMIPAAWAGQGLSVQQAKEQVAKAPRAQASQALVQSAKAGEEAATGMFYPMVNLSHGYMLTDNPVGVFSAKLEQARFDQADFAIPALNDPGSVSHWRTRLEVVQPILHGTVDIKNQRAAEHQARSEAFQHEYRLQQLKLNAVQLYWASVAAAERSRIAEEGIQRLKRLEDRYQLMAAPTSATTTNFLIAQSVRLNLSAQRSALASAASATETQLVGLLGLPSGTELDLTDPLPPVEAKMDSPKESASERSDVKAVSEQSLAASQALGAARGDWWPRLDAMAGYNIYTGAYDDFETAYDVGLVLSWPIFQGPRTATIRRASAAQDSVERSAQALAREAEASESVARRNLVSRIDEFGLIQSGEAKAAEAIELAKKRYEQGTLPLFDYSQSIQNWVGVRQELIEAQRRVAEARALLEFEQGAL